MAARASPGRQSTKGTCARFSDDGLPGTFWVPFIDVPDDSVHSKPPHGFKTIAHPEAIWRVSSHLLNGGDELAVG